MAGVWPGFCPDAKARWERAAIRKRKRTANVLTLATPRGSSQKDPTYPKSAIAREKTPSKKTKDAVVALAEKYRDIPVESTELTKQQVKNRDLLADGETGGQRNHHVLAANMRFVPQGRERFLGYVQRAMRNGDPDARAWWRIFADLNEAQQARCDLDDICEAAGVPPDRLLAIVVSSAVRLGNDMGDWVAAALHPEVVAKTVESSLRIKGKEAGIAQKDREMLFQHHRFIPVPRGANVTVHASAQAAAAASSEPSVPTFSESLDDARASQASVQRQLSERPVVDVEATES